jgi:predicted nuclease of predicted toxin-antitoxin system
LIIPCWPHENDLAGCPFVTASGALAFGRLQRPSVAVRDLGLRQAEDHAIFFAARKAGALVVTKDNDFVELLERHGSPPKIIWLTCGNASEAALREIFAANFPEALRLFDAGDDLVEFGTP